MRSQKESQASQLAFDLAKIKYETGLTDFSTLLDAERSLLTLQDELSTSNGTVTSNLVSLYKALGGGWSPQVNNKKTDSPPTGAAPSASQNNK